MDLEERAYRHIRERVLLGQLRPGQRVSEVDIARELRISRTPVRHAIRQLEGDGLIEQVARSGTYIRLLSKQDLLELWQYREALEVMAVGMAVGRISREELTELARLIDEFRLVAEHARRSRVKRLDAAWTERIAKADTMFHSVILHAAGNKRFLKSFADLHLMASLFLTPTAQSPIDVSREVAKLYRDHARIYRAIRQGDVAAARHWMSQSLGNWADPAAREKIGLDGFFIGEPSGNLREWLAALDAGIGR